jgi:predicted histidine transporter YuiF (NhaC family)
MIASFQKERESKQKEKESKQKEKENKEKESKEKSKHAEEVEGVTFVNASAIVLISERQSLSNHSQKSV